MPNQLISMTSTVVCDYRIRIKKSFWFRPTY